MDNLDLDCEFDYIYELKTKLALPKIHDINLASSTHELLLNSCILPTTTVESNQLLLLEPVTDEVKTDFPVLLLEYPILYDFKPSPPFHKVITDSARARFHVNNDQLDDKPSFSSSTAAALNYGLDQLISDKSIENFEFSCGSYPNNDADLDALYLVSGVTECIVSDLEQPSTNQSSSSSIQSPLTRVKDIGNEQIIDEDFYKNLIPIVPMKYGIEELFLDPSDSCVRNLGNDLLYNLPKPDIEMLIDKSPLDILYIDSPILDENDVEAESSVNLISHILKPAESETLQNVPDDTVLQLSKKSGDGDQIKTYLHELMDEKFSKNHMSYLMPYPNVEKLVHELSNGCQKTTAVLGVVEKNEVDALNLSLKWNPLISAKNHEEIPNVRNVICNKGTAQPIKVETGRMSPYSYLDDPIDRQDDFCGSASQNSYTSLSASSSGIEMFMNMRGKQILQCQQSTVVKRKHQAEDDGSNETAVMDAPLAKALKASTDEIQSINFETSKYVVVSSTIAVRQQFLKSLEDIGNLKLIYRNGKDSNKNVRFADFTISPADGIYLIPMILLSQTDFTTSRHPLIGEFEERFVGMYKRIFIIFETQKSPITPPIQAGYNQFVTTANTKVVHTFVSRTDMETMVIIRNILDHNPDVERFNNNLLDSLDEFESDVEKELVQTGYFNPISCFMAISTTLTNLVPDDLSPKELQRARDEIWNHH